MEKNQSQLPQVIQQPVWKSNDIIEINGAEWQAISDFISNSERAVMAFHAVMNKNVLNGTIKMKFQKLNEDGTEYVDLSAADSKPYQEEFEKMLTQAKELAQKAYDEAENPEPPSQEGLPRIDALVDAQGQPLEAKVISL